MNSPEQRRAVRGVILSPEGLVLLISLRQPATGHRFWLPPGGGLEPGEDHAACLRRELYEETGLRDAAIGPWIWKRHHTFEWGDRTISQEEAFYLIQTPRFTPNAANNPCASEAAAVEGFRWWNVPDILACSDLFVPRRLGQYLKALIETGPPREPIDVGV